MKKILVTGTAGFIGSHLSARLLDEGFAVVGLDNLNDYYDVGLKRDRLKMLLKGELKNYETDISDTAAVMEIFEAEKPDIVVNLAAQAGVRYSIDNPHAYIKSNIDGFMNILEGCRHHGVSHLVYASSSSVYGANTAKPFATSANIDHPLSLYAATKKANELMAHTYSHLYGLPTTGLRFFTVYGPWGRPDMALFKFTEAMLSGAPIDVYNNGHMMRDFTYIDDIVEGITRLIDHVPQGNPEWRGDAPDPASSRAPYRVYNIGNNAPVSLMAFIEAIEHHLGMEAVKHYMPLQPGDVPETYADVDDLYDTIGFQPATDIDTGVRRFIEWYMAYYSVKPEMSDAG